MNWIDVGSIDDIPLRGSRIVKTAIGCVALFRTDTAEVFATSDRCPHKGGPLSDGIVHDKSVTCPLHNWVFSLESGEAQGADEGKIDTFSVRVEKGRIMMNRDEFGARSAA